MSSAGGEHLRAVVQGPPEQGQEVDHGLREVAHLAVLGDGGGAVALAQLGAVGGQDDGQVGEERRRPAEGLVEAQVAWRAGEPLLGPEHVADLHIVVVDHVGEVVCGEAVGLEQYEVVDQRVLEGDAASHDVVQGRRAVLRHGEPDHAGCAVAFVLRPLRRGKAAAEAVVADVTLAARLLVPHLPQALGGAVAGVGLASVHEPLCGRVVANEALGLVVRGIAAADVRSLVPVDPKPPEGFQDLVHGPFHLPGLVGVLYAHHEGAAGSAGQQPVEEGRAYVAQVWAAGGAGREPYPHVRRAGHRVTSVRHSSTESRASRPGSAASGR